ncbi:MAG TPA: hypothetical protein VM367_07540, partial [Pseudonocardia sp.]|nr:hypothetical protein [Pseudonocardia sp.]
LGARADGRVPRRGEPVWHVYTAPVPATEDACWLADVPPWLARLRAFRAEVLFADGLRPAFRDVDGRFRDDDPVDPFAHHVVATLDGVPIATLRVVPIEFTRIGFCERMFGGRAVEKVLAAAGSTRATTWEGSGWAVGPTRRGAAMGSRVLAAGSAVARELGLTTAIGAAGRRYGQLYRILSAGYQRAEDIAPVEVPSLADDVQLVHGTLDELRPSFRDLVERIRPLLRWDTGHPLG